MLQFKRQNKKRLLAVGLTAALSVSLAYSVLGSPLEDIAWLQYLQEQEAAEIGQIQTAIADLEQKKSDILTQINGYDAQIVTTIATINSLTQQIASKEKELEKTAVMLKKAEEDEKNQYEAMKNRIQYMYEQGGDLGLAGVVLGENNLSGVLNRAEDTQSMYDYDRACLDEYTRTIDTITKLQAKQREQKSALLEMKRTQTGVQEHLENLKAEAQKTSDDYDKQMVDAAQQALAYQQLIEQQNAEIARLYEVQRQIEIAAAQEAARQAAAAAAAQAAAQQAAAQQAAAQQAAAQQQQEYVETSDAGYVDANAGYVETDAGNVDANAGYTDTSSTNTSDTSRGQEIANYALQFVGNPYVWGGTDLVNGADCSGFVQSVYGDNGISLSRTTYTQMNEGTAVSYDEMQPGDVINYGYHTAIYVGDNKIVHAADESLGIIVSDNPAFEPIVTIRRFV